jgi:hypothetical protein
VRGRARQEGEPAEQLVEVARSTHPGLLRDPGTNHAPGARAVEISSTLRRCAMRVSRSATGYLAGCQRNSGLEPSSSCAARSPNRAIASKRRARRRFKLASSPLGPLLTHRRRATSLRPGAPHRLHLGCSLDATKHPGEASALYLAPRVRPDQQASTAGSRFPLTLERG